MMLPDRLYMAYDRTEVEYDEHDQVIAPDDPDGWAEYSAAKFGEYKPFFFPTSRKVYRSRSAAEERVALINRWGGDAVVVECTPVWRTVAVANAERARARLQVRIDRLRAELADACEQFEVAA